MLLITASLKSVLLKCCSKVSYYKKLNRWYQMNSFPAVPNPSKIDRSPTWRTLETTFGDGYKQFSPDGVNTKETVYDLTWSILTQQDHGTLETFLDTQTPVYAFLWTDPKKNSVETVRFVKDSFKYSDENVNYYNVSLKLKTAYGY